jgi:thiamine biosynthesis lipoprotein
MEVTEHRTRVMASDVHIIAIDAPASAVADASGLLERLERRWSRFLPDSDISRLNASRGRPTEVDPLTLTLVAAMIEANHATGGRYDPTVLPILVSNGYASSISDPSNVTVLPSSAIHVRTMGAVVVDSEHRTVTTPPGMALDPGGIGKGLAADLVVVQLLAAGAAGALVDVGGDLSCAGTSPEPNGWLVTIEQPDEPRADLITFTTTGGGVATSSTRSRRWTARGVTRHHIIDPGSGAMASTDLVAVTVVASSGWLAEAHATAAILTGTTGVREYLNAHCLSGLAIDTNRDFFATSDLDPIVAASRQATS